MICYDVIENLCDYDEGDLSPATRKEMEAHLDQCISCAAYLKTYQSIPVLFRQFGNVHIPSVVQINLRNTIHQKIKDL